MHKHKKYSHSDYEREKIFKGNREDFKKGINIFIP